MGLDLYEADADVKEIFTAADRITGLPITRLCFEGPMEELTQTVNLQPAVTAVNLACLTLLEKQKINPWVCAGHSLGEYSALRAAGVISTADSLKLVFQRGQLMHREATRNAGSMSAIVGLAIAQVEAAVRQVAGKGVVAVANHNSVDQIVITGEPEAVQAAAEEAAQMGGRAIALKVSGAWHSPLIQGAEAEFRICLDAAQFTPPAHTILHNVTAAPEDNPEEIKALMARQLCSPVRWYDTMVKMIQEQVEVFIEIGPGKVLTGLLKKSLPRGYAAEIYNVSDLPSLEKVLQAIA